MIIKICRVCGTKNRVVSHVHNSTPVCGKCSAQLFDNSNDPANISPYCVICGISHKATKTLSNGSVYHEECYAELTHKIQKTELEIKNNELQFEQFALQLCEDKTLISKIKSFFSGNRVNIESIKRQMELIEKDNRELSDKKSRLKSLLTELYIFWPKYPPDWESRRLQIHNRSEYCEECGAFEGPLHVHHRIPIAKGGSHAIDNLVLLCENCHTEAHGGREFTDTDFSKIGSFARRLELIRNAIMDNKIIHFNYKKFDGQKSVRSIRPEGLKQVGESLCVYGHCYLRNDSRTFAIKRMMGVKQVSEPKESYEIKR